MDLYTINHIYPNNHFAFTLTASAMNLAPAVHGHEKTQITGLVGALDGLADLDHEHNQVTQLYNNQTDESAHSVSISVVTNGTISASNGGIVLSFSSTATGHTLWVMNNNAKSEKKLIQVSTDENEVVTDSTMALIQFKENRNA